MKFENGGKFDGFFLLSAANIKTAANGSTYLDMKLQDADGLTPAKLWDYKTESGIHEQVGKIVKVRATPGEYNGATQLTVAAIRLATEKDQYDVKTIVPSAPIDANTTAELLKQLIGAIPDDEYRKVAETAFERFHTQLATAPAAVHVHHAFPNGLLMHTSNMVQMAFWLSTLYPHVDKSLLACGTFLHDIGKLWEMDVSELGLAKDYTDAGKLLGHLYIGAGVVAKICDEVGVSKRKSMLLQHMLLSHHGQPEFGAAVRPKCAEAELLSLIDMIDSRMEIYRETCESMAPGEWSDKIWSLNNEKVLKTEN